MAAGVASLGPMQLARKVAIGLIAILALAAIVLIATPVGWDQTHEAVEGLGLALIGACIAGRCWCTLYIGGRKGAELVDKGPYSICRNPLYFFSFLGAAGIGAQTGSLVLAAAFTFIGWAVFRVVVSREEAFLRGALGEPYAAYLNRVPRFLPNPSLWRGVDLVEVRPRRVVLTFADGLFFLVALPVAEGAEWLQVHGFVPVLLRLP